MTNGKPAVRSREHNGGRRRWENWRRRLIAAVLAIALGIGIAATTYHVSVQPGAALVKTVFEAAPEVKPPKGFPAVRATVDETSHIAITAKGVPQATMDIYRPKEKETDRLPVILWIHGGGFISSSADTVADYAIMLAHEGYVVASLDYSLAPGAKYPTPVIQGNAALEYLAKHSPRYGGDPARIVLGGDSAGAQIAGQLVALETNPALANSMHIIPALSGEQLRAVVLFCGLYDLKTVGTTGFPALRTYLWAYTGVRQWTDYSNINELAVVRQVTAKYPPTFVTVGDADPFRTQATELASALREKKVPLTTLFWNGTGDGLTHEYQFNFALPQANHAFAATLAFLATQTHSRKS
jgi:acetyl esterase/lipase